MSTTQPPAGDPQGRLERGREVLRLEATTIERLAGELGPHDITVNCFAPGMIPTEMNRFAGADDARKKALLDTLSLRRWGDAQDVANLVCFLCSDLAGYITGAMIDISGAKFATQMP